MHGVCLLGSSRSYQVDGVNSHSAHFTPLSLSPWSKLSSSPGLLPHIWRLCQDHPSAFFKLSPCPSAIPSFIWLPGPSLPSQECLFILWVPRMTHDYLSWLTQIRIITFSQSSLNSQYPFDSLNSHNERERRPAPVRMSAYSWLSHILRGLYLLNMAAFSVKFHL